MLLSIKLSTFNVMKCLPEQNLDDQILLIKFIFFWHHSLTRRKFVLVLVLYTHKGTFFSCLVPILQPCTGADTVRILSVHLTFLFGFVTALFDTEQPLVISIPAMQGLILWRESCVAGGCADVLHLMQKIFLFFIKFRNSFTENLIVGGRGEKWLKVMCVRVFVISTVPRR